MVKYAPDRGDIVWLDFEPQKGREITKTRPALVISPKKYNLKTSLAIFMPITSQVKGYPFEVEIHNKQISGAILCDQVRSLDWNARKAKKIVKLDSQSLEEAISKLQLILTS